jgi:hypothetical protein
MMSANDCVEAGGSVQVSFGETSGPSQVNFFGIDSPGENAVVAIWKAMDAPFAWLNKVAFAGQNKQKKAAAKATNLRDMGEFLREKS